MWIAQSLGTIRPFTNFGDELSRYVLQYAFQEKVKWAAPRNAEMLGVGSLIDFYLQAGGSGAEIWGSGVRDPRWFSDNPGAVERLGKVLAVRGPHSAHVLGIGSQEVGDPGILAASLLADTGRRIVRNGTSFLPHFRTWKTKEGRREIQLARSSGLKIISPTETPLRATQLIADSEMLFTSSLHGIIVAHAVGTPVQPVTHTVSASEPTFKYDDYFSSIDRRYDPLVLKNCLQPQVRHQSFEMKREQSQMIRLRVEALSESLVAAAREKS
ncbi:MAG: hypothetical protein EOP31_22250 [Rhodococcus sp. (in: high G+C Gram-positive bacteria)]|uniref:polysaccharide pyruvyl transferase family protein n=1 Tax=Rhodococcus sp. TaxID=1831 RepID=UPI00120BF893|nr:polysaccharide pyruvyl transferase family protein [Rhodococcus sp. (in: high G+C Gram-positive bacteria)]RZL22687.1 MAG: hypothetical protein EOP31_22250 [Rhodococcus sp. (in: high G+C Gram-positive bacteria)]